MSDSTIIACLFAFAVAVCTYDVLLFTRVVGA